MKTKETIKQELALLIEQGRALKFKWESNDCKDKQEEFQVWYTQSSKSIQTFLPNRFDEFISYYLSKNSEYIEENSAEPFYAVQDFLFDRYPYSGYTSGAILKEKGRDLAITKLGLLISMVSAVMLFSMDSILFNLDERIYYEYQEDELEAARAVFNVNIRAAGALCGVIIEKHLKRLLDHYNLQCTKKNPGVNDLAMPLKNAEIIDIAYWRKISYLADLRNLCDHAKSSEPTEKNVTELLNGTKWLIVTVL